MIVYDTGCTRTLSGLSQVPSYYWSVCKQFPRAKPIDYSTPSNPIVATKCARLPIKLWDMDSGRTIIHHIDVNLVDSDAPFLLSREDLHLDDTGSRPFLRISGRSGHSGPRFRLEERGNLLLLHDPFLTKAELDEVGPTSRPFTAHFVDGLDVFTCPAPVLDDGDWDIEHIIPPDVEDGIVNEDDDELDEVSQAYIAKSKISSSNLSLSQILTYHRILGHPGPNRLFLTLNKHDTWHVTRADCEEVCKSCKVCPRVKRIPSSKWGHEPRDDEEPSKILERISVDLMYLTYRNNGDKMYIMVVQDRYSNWVEIKFINSKIQEKVLEAYKLAWHNPHEFPTKSLTVDNGKEFFRLRAWLEEHGVKIDTTPPYHPQGNPKNERSHATLGQILRSVLMDLNLKHRRRDPVILKPLVENFLPWALNHTASPSLPGKSAPAELFSGQCLRHSGQHLCQVKRCVASHICHEIRSTLTRISQVWYSAVHSHIAMKRHGLSVRIIESENLPQGMST